MKVTIYFPALHQNHENALRYDQISIESRAPGTQVSRVYGGDNNLTTKI